MTRIDTEQLHRLADNPDHTHLELTSEEVKKIAAELDRFYVLLEEIFKGETVFVRDLEVPVAGGRVPTRGGHPAGRVASLNLPVRGVTVPREADRTEEELAAWLDLVAERRHAERGEA